MPTTDHAHLWSVCRPLRDLGHERVGGMAGQNVLTGVAWVSALHCVQSISVLLKLWYARKAGTWQVT